MTDHVVVSRADWLAARKGLLKAEKEFTRARDALSDARRQMPWVKVDSGYIFDGPDGEESLADLFNNHSQLIVYHFMFAPDWDEGCPSCSFWADNFNATQSHLAARDISLIAVSRADQTKLQAYRNRMDWSFKWVTDSTSAFSADFGVYFTDAQRKSGEIEYNYRQTDFPVSDAPGVSVFARNEAGDVYHTYSCYSRGLDILNGGYHYMDLTPRGRDEQDLPGTMAWLRRKDQYPK